MNGDFCNNLGGIFGINDSKKPDGSQGYGFNFKLKVDVSGVRIHLNSELCIIITNLS